MSFHDNLLSRKNRSRPVEAEIQPATNDNATCGSNVKGAGAIGEKLSSDRNVSLDRERQEWRSQIDGPPQDAGLEDARPYSVPALAARWECSEGIIRGLIRNETLGHFRIGTLVRIRASEVERFECR
ncbi:helix-turn-helix domain-containing protein [Qipengyuania nanhaisediminis]|uniref:helix-turn-helix domain-containing protein n=1 Tax=Qipengyuania nanhaisediminis TaxID=604088 RepID=UPI0011605267|nr:helix-turn-helix domain-containing protein [Qipengyuania nanhaisediminis]